MNAKNRTAFLDMISVSEGTDGLGHNSDGYDIVVGSKPGHEIRIRGGAEPGCVVVELSETLWSSAAGRYQLIENTWKSLKQTLGLKDFSPGSQDAAATELLRQSGALPHIDAGRIENAIRAAQHIWASLPGAGYGQHENAMSKLVDVYKQKGGEVA